MHREPTRGGRFAQTAHRESEACIDSPQGRKVSIDSPQGERGLHRQPTGGERFA